MCGRFAVNITPQMMGNIFALQSPLGAESFNVAPTQEVPVVIQTGNQREMQLQRFGFVPFFAKDPKDGVRSINARIETVSEKAAFKKAVQDHRCVIPASGFFEWADGKVKQPFYWSPKTRSPLAFGGIWSHKRFGETDVYSFAILTTSPHPAVKLVHDRSPLMLSEETIDRWLDNRPVDSSFLDTVTHHSHSLPLDCWPVDRRVGNVRNNDAALIEPVTFDAPLFAPHEARMD